MRAVREGHSHPAMCFAIARRVPSSLSPSTTVGPFPTVVFSVSASPSTSRLRPTAVLCSPRECSSPGWGDAFDFIPLFHRQTTWPRELADRYRGEPEPLDRVPDGESCSTSLLDDRSVGHDGEGMAPTPTYRTPLSAKRFRRSLGLISPKSWRSSIGCPRQTRPGYRTVCSRCSPTSASPRATAK